MYALKIRGLIVGLIFATCSLAVSQERILEFHSDVTIHSDTSLTVTETILVTALGQRIKRGIFRDFPRDYQSKSRLKRVRGFEVEEVLRNGVPEHYHIESIAGGSRIRIGNAATLLSHGVHTYTIRYRTTRQLGYFENHDELYWNVTGNGWEFPIAKATATVRAPEGASIIGMEAYTGVAGNKDRNYRSNLDPGGNAFFETILGLERKEGITVVVTFPKGHLNYANDKDGLFRMLVDNPGFLVGGICLLFVGIYYTIAWLLVGKDPRSSTVIPQYGPPKGFSAAAVRFLYKMKFDDQVFTSGLIGLAARGMITIQEQSGVYTLFKKKPKFDAEPDEKAIFDILLGNHRDSIVIQSETALKFHGAKVAQFNSLRKKLLKNYFSNNTFIWLIGLIVSFMLAGLSILLSGGAIGLFIGVVFWSLLTFCVLAKMIGSCIKRKPNYAALLLGIIMTVAWGWLFYVFSSKCSVPLGVILISSLIISIQVRGLLKAPTAIGQKMLDHIEGFKHYLSVAEADRLGLENPPERTPQLFEEFLPYAAALEVEQQWADQFASVLEMNQLPDSNSEQQYPGYLVRSSPHHMTPTAVGAAMASSLTSAIASSSVSPSSRSGSSFSGSRSSSSSGGSSGGGGGGGGGGGW